MFPRAFISCSFVCYWNSYFKVHILEYLVWSFCAVVWRINVEKRFSGQAAFPACSLFTLFLFCCSGALRMSVELSSSSYLVYLLYVTVGKATQLHLQGRKLFSLKPSRFSTKVSVKILAFIFICIYSFDYIHFRVYWAANSTLLTKLIMAALLVLWKSRNLYSCFLSFLLAPHTCLWHYTSGKPQEVYLRN